MNSPRVCRARSACVAMSAGTRQCQRPLPHRAGWSARNLRHPPLSRAGRDLCPPPGFQRTRPAPERAAHAPSTGLAGSLHTLHLDGNRLSSLAPLAPLTSLRMLTAGANALRNLRGLGGLTALRRLALGGNQLGRLEEVAAVAGALLLAELDLRGNPLERVRGWLWSGGRPPMGRRGSVWGWRDGRVRTARRPASGLMDGCPRAGAAAACNQHCVSASAAHARGQPRAEHALPPPPRCLPPQALAARLHAVHLLPQLLTLDGALVTPAERTAAASMHGAEADALLAIRRRCFPRGELDDGGGAVPPYAAGGPRPSGRPLRTAARRMMRPTPLARRPGSGLRCGLYSCTVKVGEASKGAAQDHRLPPAPSPARTAQAWYRLKARRNAPRAAPTLCTGPPTPQRTRWGGTQRWAGPLRWWPRCRPRQPAAAAAARRQRHRRRCSSCGCCVQRGAGFLHTPRHHAVKQAESVAAAMKGAPAMEGRRREQLRCGAWSRRCLAATPTPWSWRR